MKCFVFHFKDRRGISQVIGSLMMLAIVAAIGSVLLFQGMNGVNNFNNYVQSFMGVNADAAREDLIIEHIYFQDTTDRVYIWVRNTGIVDATINSVAMVRIDNQELIIDEENLVVDVPIKDRTLIMFFNNNVTFAAVPEQWNDGDYSSNREYHIAITTTEGNSFSKVATTFNT